MNTSIFRSPVWAWLITAVVSIFVSCASLQAGEISKRNYPETIAVLQLPYASEIIAGFRYQTYAQVASDEGYANIAHLLTAMAASVAMHARSFQYSCLVGCGDS